MGVLQLILAHVPLRVSRDPTIPMGITGPNIYPGLGAPLATTSGIRDKLPAIETTIVMTIV